MSASAVAMKQTTVGYQLLTVVDRFWLSITGCREHNWSFPQTSRAADWQTIYSENDPNNSHQQCSTCGAMRLYNSRTMEAGPLLSKEVKQHG